MKKSLFIAALFAAALAVSCQQEENVVDKPHDYITVTLQLPGNETKLGIDVVEEGEKKVGKVKWEAGDKINIHGNLISEAKIVELKAEDISADGYSATITFDKAGMTEKSPHGYYAEYPAEAVGYFLSSSEASYNSEFIDTNKPLMSAYLDGTTFIFRNLCGVISFTITDNSYDSYVFSGNNDETVGYQQFAIKRTATETYTKRSIGDLTSISGDVIADGVTQNFICIPIANWDPTEFTQGFSIKFKKGDKIVKEAKTNNSVNIDRNTYLPLGDITDVLVDYVKPTHHTSITEAVDLGATETANCYVITKAGSYMIPCVKGNSEESAGVRAKSKLLWETYCTAEEVTKNSVIAAVDYDDDNNYVYFKTPETLKPGNALIAAVDSEDNIIWSWHIWIPESDIQTIGDYKVSTKYLMDRNLGALTGEAGQNGKNYGMLYQWGRKDPRVGLDGTGGTKYAKTAPSGAISAVSIADYGKTVLDAIQNPTVFYVNNHVWYDSVNTAEELWSPTSKTIYDPCPAGWIVPGKDAIATGPSVEDATNGGVTVDDVYFPGTGGASRYTGTWKEGNTYLWSSTTYASSDNKNDRAHWFLFKDAESAGFSSKEYKTTSAPVRCVKIDGEVPAPDLVGATSVVLDGSFGDWSDADTIAESGDIKEWKFGSDASNIYFYFKIPRSNVIAGKEEEAGMGYPFNSRRYIYLAINTDNDETTGVPASDGGLSITGCETQALVFPFRGYSTTASGTDGVEVVNGVDNTGYIQTPIGTAVEDGYITAFGAVEESFVYLEIGIPRDKIGNPANGKMKVQFSLSWNLTSEKVFTVK